MKEDLDGRARAEIVVREIQLAERLPRSVPQTLAECNAAFVRKLIAGKIQSMHF